MYTSLIIPTDLEQLNVCCELTTTILVAEVWEPPHITQANDFPSHRQHELHFVPPLASLFHFLHFYLFTRCGGPIGFSFLGYGSCHDSVGQKRRRAGDVGHTCGKRSEGTRYHNKMCSQYQYVNLGTSNWRHY